MRLLGSAGHRTQPCRDALPRPAGPAALPRKTVLDGPAALVATVPYGCGPKPAPRDAPPPFGPPAVASLGAPSTQVASLLGAGPASAPIVLRPLGPGIDGSFFRCARSSRPHPLQQSHERRALPNEMHFSRGAVTPGGSASWVTVLSTTAAWLNGPRRRLQMPVRERGPQNQLCRDALPRPAGPAALPPKTVLDGSAALVATVPYGCGPRTAPRDAPPPFRPASRCVTGSAVNPSRLATRCRPGQCPERLRPLGPAIDGRVRCARSSKPHPQQQSSGTSRAT